MKRLALLLLPCLAVLSSGCIILPIPHPRTHQPPREGRVVDAVTGEPVAGARVVSTGLEERLRTTDAEGRFRFPAVRSWHGAYLCTPALSYSIFPTLDVPVVVPQSVRVSADGYQTYDEKSLPVVAVPFRSFGRKEHGLWTFPVETNYVSDLYFSRGRPYSDPVRHFHLDPPGWRAFAEDARSTIRLRPENAAPPVRATPFSVWFELADDAAEPYAEGIPPPKARILWYGPDRPLEVDFGERIPLWKAYAFDVPVVPWEVARTRRVYWWEEVKPFFLPADGPGRVVLELRDGTPVRFSVRTGEPWEPEPPENEEAREKTIRENRNGGDLTAFCEAESAAAAVRRAEIGAGYAFRVANWEILGRDGSTPSVWNELSNVDPRIEIVNESNLPHPATRSSAEEKSHAENAESAVPEPHAESAKFAE